MKCLFTVLTLFLLSSGIVSAQQSKLIFEKSDQQFEECRTYHIALGDIDSDGDLDAVFSNMGEKNNSTVWINDGSGQFIDSGQRLISESHGAAFADLDSDGDLDLFLTDNDNHEATANKLYFNDGSGKFADSGLTIGQNDMYGNSAAFVDVNNDGKADMHIDYYKAPNKIYYGKNGSLSLESDMQFPDGTYVYWSDFDGDGDTDIFAKIIGEGLQVRLNDGTGKFSDHWAADDKDITSGDAAIADFDGDNDTDIFISNGSREGIFPSRILINDGSGNFKFSSQTIPGVMFSKVAAADFNSDGHMDVMFSNMDKALSIWVNDGSGKFSDSGQQLGGGYMHGVSAAGDLDTDGDIDIFQAGYHGGSNLVWFNKTK